jgi:hypothetical protein
VFGQIELLPGADVANSVMLPIPTEWWLRPVNKAERVGEQSAVVWKRVYFNPVAASRSKLGVWQGPPNALDAPKPMSSIRITSTMGAPTGGMIDTIGDTTYQGPWHHR